LKMVINTEEPLSAPQSGLPDSIAHDFLTDHSAMFKLNRSQIFEMRLKNEDIDQGTSFLNYEQTIDGIPVFQSQVQVAINSAEQVMSVNKSLMIPNAIMNTIPRLSENEGIQKAFLSANKQTPASFNMMENRLAKDDRAVYQNP